ncbi:MAG: AAA family ATPase [Deltaproteobacteria bacterium]|nr:AAA family ATPase [Deltaproteobacteria bacterium]
MISHHYQIKDEHLEIIIDEVRDAIKESGLNRIFNEIEKSPWGTGEHTLQLIGIIERILAITSTLISFADDYSGEKTWSSILFGIGCSSRWGSNKLDEITRFSVRTKNTFKPAEVKELFGNNEIHSSICKDLVLFLKKDRISNIYEMEKAVCGYFHLLSDSIELISGDPRNISSNRKLKELKIDYEDYCFTPFSTVHKISGSENILNVAITDIIGNREYLDAGVKLVRDLTGFDPSTGKNPKKFNQILFGLGRPGCGKTVTANALGNYLLEKADEAGLESRFVTIRRTDWASSYQNASATALLERFESQLRDYNGVVIYYWPDIDTAFSSRSSGELREEEKSILGTAFGLFDGTVLPFNGQWALICDANYMQMDEATISRLSQSPHTVKGPETPEDYIYLIRDILLGKEYFPSLQLSDESWDKIGKQCIEYSLSGRDVANICRRLIGTMEDFDWPDGFFKSSYDQRVALVRENRIKIDEKIVSDELSSFYQFKVLAGEHEIQEKTNFMKEQIIIELNARKLLMEEGYE